jgi:hypothetical protein
VLAALLLSLVLFYAMGSAVTARNGYTAVTLRRELEDLRAQNALLRYQINLAESNQRIQQAAARMELRQAGVQEVDYVVLSYPERGAATALAAADPIRETGRLAAALAELAAEVSISARGQAEASTGQGRRR